MIGVTLYLKWARELNRAVAETLQESDIRVVNVAPSMVTTALIRS